MWPGDVSLTSQQAVRGRTRIVASVAPDARSAPPRPRAAPGARRCPRRPALLAWLVTVRAQAAARHHDRAGRRGLRASKGVGSGDAPFIITRTVADGLPRGQILSQ